MTPSIPEIFLNRAGEFLDAHPDVKDNRALVALAFMEVDGNASAGAYGLTKRQGDAYSFICAFIKQHRISPTVDEIREACGFASKSSVARVLDGLEERNLIRRLHSRARSIALVGGGIDA